MKKTTWILVADGARARILRNDGPGTGLAPALDHDFAAPHAPTREFGADKPGRTAVPGDGKRHGMEPPVDWHREEKRRFALDLCKVLDEGAEEHAYDKLVLVAPPDTLGDLRKGLTLRARDRVHAEMGKDLTHLAARELTRHLDKVMVT